MKCLVVKWCISVFLSICKFLIANNFFCFLRAIKMLTKICVKPMLRTNLSPYIWSTYKHMHAKANLVRTTLWYDKMARINSPTNRLCHLTEALALNWWIPATLVRTYLSSQGKPLWGFIWFNDTIHRETMDWWYPRIKACISPGSKISLL